MTTNTLNGVGAIHAFYFAAKATNRFFQGSWVIKIYIQPHNSGDFVMAQYLVFRLRERFKNFHFCERYIQLFIVANKAHASRVQEQIMLFLPFWTIKKLGQSVSILVCKSVAINTVVGPGKIVFHLVVGASTGDRYKNY